MPTGRGARGAGRITQGAGHRAQGAGLGASGVGRGVRGANARGMEVATHFQVVAVSAEARRFFSDEQKLAIALESDQPGASVSGVARKHGIVTGLLFRWRVEFGIGRKARLATVRVPEGMVLPMDLVQPPPGMVSVTLENEARVFVPEGSDPDVVRLEMAREGAVS